MNFIRKIFNGKSNIDLESSKIKSDLEVLENAICDIGWWSWWTAELPNILQIEFGGTQLYFEKTQNENPPNNQIAIQFINPKSISFLSRNNNQIEENWAEKLQNDKLELPSCDYEKFSFANKNLMKSIIDEAETINTIYGNSPKDISFYTEKYKLVFWAQNYGIAVNAEEIKLMSHNGKIELEDIREINNSWWKYWKKYWSLKYSKNPLPKDNLCEITIPTEKFKFTK